jgi:polyisoprenoid-binding protein YceI
MAIEKWEIDSGHSGINFSVRHLVISKVRGKFARWSGSIEAPTEDASKAALKVTIDASSIDTGVADRDTHLKSGDFLDVANFPEITFEGRRVEKTGKGLLRVTGDLTLHGVTKKVVLDVEDAGRTKDPWGNVRAGFAAKTSLDRKDFGLTWNQALEAGGVVVGERVDVEIEVEAVKQAAEKAA